MKSIKLILIVILKKYYLKNNSNKIKTAVEIYYKINIFGLKNMHLYKIKYKMCYDKHFIIVLINILYYFKD